MVKLLPTAEVSPRRGEVAERRADWAVMVVVLRQVWRVWASKEVFGDVERNWFAASIAV